MPAPPAREQPKGRGKKPEVGKRGQRGGAHAGGGRPAQRARSSRSGHSGSSGSAAPHKPGGHVPAGRTPHGSDSCGQTPTPKATKHGHPSGLTDGAPAEPEGPPRLKHRQASLTSNPTRFSQKPPAATRRPSEVAEEAFEEDSENWLRNRLRRLLQVNAVLAAIVGALLLLVFVLFSIKITTQETCRTPHCEDYARLLGDALNVSVNPCESFTQFVCDRWTQQGVPEKLVADAIETMVRLVNVTYLPKTGQDSAQRGLALYRSCDAVLQGQRDALADVKAALKEAGITWPRRPTEIDIPHTILATSLQLGWDVMFRVIPLWLSHRHPSGMLVLNSGRTIIEIINKTDKTAPPDKRELYFDNLRRYFESPGNESKGSHPGDLVSFEDVMKTEKAAVRVLTQAYYRPEVIPPAPFPGLMDNSSFGLSRAGWEKALSRFNLAKPIPSSGFEFGTANGDYLKAFLELWAKLKTDKMHLFISWCTVQVGALFASQELIVNFYGGDHNATQILHGAFCFSRAFAVSGPNLFTRYNERYQSSSTLEGARRIALSVRSSFHERLRRWIGYKENVTVIADWDSVDTLFGLVQAGGRGTSHGKTSRGSGDSFMVFPDMDEHSLLSNLRKTSSKVALESDEFDVARDVEVSSVLASLTKLQFTATFYGLSDFQLMPYALTFPLYDVDLVPGLNFGGLGAEIAQTLGQFTLKSYRNVSGPLKARGEVRKCFHSSPFGKDRRVNLFLALAEALALGALVDAYDASARDDHRNRMRLPGLTRYSGTQLLFMAFCLPKCRGSIANYTPPSACNLPLTFLPQFSQAFTCADGTPMNPTEKCDLL
ncbi:neprilysin-1-like [Haemaphysalis longicornis]